MENSTLNKINCLIDSMALKDRIREAMEAAQLTKAEFARATKSSPGAVTQWLSGETKSLKAETAEKMEVATGYRSGWLVSGKGQKKKEAATEPPPDAQTGAIPAPAKSMKSGEQISYLFNMIPDGAPQKEVAYNACLAAILRALQPTASPPTSDTEPSVSQGRRHA